MTAEERALCAHPVQPLVLLEDVSVPDGAGLEAAGGADHGVEGLREGLGLLMDQSKLGLNGISTKRDVGVGLLIGPDVQVQEAPAVRLKDRDHALAEGARAPND